jgi:hypothetical protein
MKRFVTAVAGAATVTVMVTVAKAVPRVALLACGNARHLYHQSPRLLAGTRGRRAGSFPAVSPLSCRFAVACRREVPPASETHVGSAPLPRPLHDALVSCSCYHDRESVDVPNGHKGAAPPSMENAGADDDCASHPFY